MIMSKENEQGPLVAGINVPFTNLQLTIFNVPYSLFLKVINIIPLLLLFNKIIHQT